MKVYKVSISGSHKNVADDTVLHKFNFGSEVYADIDSAIKRKKDICSRIESGDTKFLFANQICLLKPVLPCNRVDADYVEGYSMTTYIYDGGYSELGVSFEPIIVRDAKE